MALRPPSRPLVSSRYWRPLVIIIVGLEDFP